MNHRPHTGILILVAALAMVIASCSTDSADPTTTSVPAAPAAETLTTQRPSTTTTEDSTASIATVPVPETVCGQELTTGFQRITCEEMVFDVAVPEVCDGTGCGLIIDVHGYSADGPFAERHTGMQGIGNAAGYVVVQPNSPQVSWNHETDDDHVRSFVDLLIEGLSLDQDRVHIGGFSQGAWMTWRFVCDHSDLIASAAPAGAGASDQIEPYPGVSCDFDDDSSPAQQVDIFYTHGTQDHDVLFDTAIQQRDLVIASWDMIQESVLANESDYRWTRWTNAEGTVFEFLEHDWQGGGLGGHCYPGVSARIGCGTETPVHYGEAALQFYIDHPKSE